MNARMIGGAAFLALLASAPLEATAQPPGGFGGSVFVGGERMFVADARHGDAGAVFVYRWDGGEWVDVQTIENPDSEAPGFGAAMAMAGNLLAISAMSQGPEGASAKVHLYRRGPDGDWSYESELEPEGPSAGAMPGFALAADGDVLATTAMDPETRTLKVMVFRRLESGWETEAVFEDPEEAAARPTFGDGLAWADGALAASAPGADSATGAVHVFERADDGSWSLARSFSGREVGGHALGVSLASYDGGFAAATFPLLTLAMSGRSDYEAADPSEVVIFRRSEAGEWDAGESLAPFDGRTLDQFGASLASDGEVLLVGSPGASEGTGAIYAFTPDGSGGWASAVKLPKPDIDSRGGQGASVAAGDGIVVAGLPGADFGLGRVQLLRREGGGFVDDGTVFGDAGSEYEAVRGGELECASGEASVFGCSDVDLVAFVPLSELGGARGARVNDIWGWTDPESGKEYAIVGRSEGTSFLDISSPDNPVLVGNLPKPEWAPGSTWRDMKVYRDHVYIVSDGAANHGMQVFDMTRLRDFAGEPLQLDSDAHYDEIASAHNIVINEETGYAYAVGASSGGETCGGGLHMIDIREPKNPVFAGCFAHEATGRRGTGYSHDAQCVVYHGPDEDYTGREICIGSNELQISIADVTDKEAPVAISTGAYPNEAYAHQGWLTEDHSYFFSNDELDEVQGKVSNTRTLIWDLRDLDEPILVKEYLSDNRSSDHNLYIRGDLMYQSNYNSGLRILDISDVENPSEVAYFDTVPGEDTPSMDGSWSNYPFFASGVIVVTSGRQGLFVVRKRDRVPVS